MLIGRSSDKEGMDTGEIDTDGMETGAIEMLKLSRGENVVVGAAAEVMLMSSAWQVSSRGKTTTATESLISRWEKYIRYRVFVPILITPFP